MATALDSRLIKSGTGHGVVDVMMILSSSAHQMFWRVWVVTRITCGSASSVARPQMMSRTSTGRRLNCGKEFGSMDTLVNVVEVGVSGIGVM